ncbi:MAG TPA: M20 family metallopeptidase [Synergistaceae bacterium]|nr:M20 family metallopeptidase [Synergistaceae bacterium]
MQSFLESAHKLQPDLIAWRRALHGIPETGMELPQTGTKILEELAKLGIPGHRVGSTWGITADMEAPRGGKTILLRSDMDALPIREATELPFASDSGNMHACGHDGHMAMLLGAAQLIRENLSSLAGRVRLLFQPGEEISQGAEALIAQGVLEGVDEVWGLHVGHIFPELAPGEIGIHRGTAMASMDRFRIEFRGAGTHGATPHRGVDPIVMGGQFLSALQTLASREIDPVHPVVVTVGRTAGGTAYNIIPEKAEMEGTFRTVTPEDRDQVTLRLKELASGIATTLGGNCEIELFRGAPPVINSPEKAEAFLQFAKELFGDSGARELTSPTMVGEDMACYLEHRPGGFFFLGAGKGDGKDYPHHHPRFDINEDVLWRGSAALGGYVLQSLGTE